MEISGSCSSSHLAAVQVEARLVPALKFQAWSPGGGCAVELLIGTETRDC